MKVIFRNKVAVWIGMVVLTATVLSLLMIGVGYKEVYIAYTGEQQLGVVYNKQQIENDYDQLKSQMMSIDPSLSFVEQPTLLLKEIKRWFPPDETEYVYTQLKSGLQYVVDAAEIRVQDQLLAIVASEAEAAQVLERVVSMYEKEGMQKGTFVESVMSQNVQVSPDQVVTSNRAFEQLTRVQKPI